MKNKIAQRILFWSYMAIQNPKNNLAALKQKKIIKHPILKNVLFSMIWISTECKTIINCKKFTKNTHIIGKYVLFRVKDTFVKNNILYAVKKYVKTSRRYCNYLPYLFKKWNQNLCLECDNNWHKHTQNSYESVQRK